jgi:hypothetical protein
MHEEKKNSRSGKYRVSVQISFKEFNNIFKTNYNIWFTMNRNIYVFQHIHENYSDILGLSLWTGL